MRTPICTECGTVFETTHPRKSVCSEECRRIRDNRYAMEHYRVNGSRYVKKADDGRAHRKLQTEKSYQVIHDPLGEDGGFPAGASFCVEEVRCMLSMRSFTAGTLLERKGKRYKVVGAKLEAI